MKAKVLILQNRPFLIILLHSCFKLNFSFWVFGAEQKSSISKDSYDSKQTPALRGSCFNLLQTPTVPPRKTSLNLLFFSVTLRFTPCSQCEDERLLVPVWLGKQELVETENQIRFIFETGSHTDPC